MELNYKTRGNSSPQGKPRVYFTAHPADYAPFLERISNEILELHNCTIWYDAAPDADYDEETLFSNLSQMQLFVVPVTTRFLCQENRALNVEFRFAMERHIPVLPLMQESGLEELFNQKCGDLQILDANKCDDTTVPDQKKLEKFLSSILVGDELTARIREAFDAYVFLSYRKKDRKYVQKLMRMIHENDFGRDLAIWYDEFLTPGENFDDAIADALRKSGLFILTVTPNMVNEDNYIVTTEYPMARKEEKPILPVEVVPTDKEALKEKFEGIPDCVDAYDEVVFSDALLTALQNIAVKKKDDSPEHKYYIGLAYLSGVDVEVDHKRAVSLITSAAEAGLIEAIEKLIQMYRNGEGVARDRHKAIQWQETLAARLEAWLSDKVTKEGLCWDDAARWISAIQELGGYYYEIGHLKDAENALTRAKGSLEYLVYGELKFGDARRELTQCYGKIGDICREDDRLDEAEQYYRKAQELLTQVVEETDAVWARHDLAVSLAGLASVCVNKKDWSKAGRYLQQALGMDRKLYEETGNVQTKRSVMVVCAQLSEFYLEQGDLDEAERYVQEALRIAQQLDEELKTPEARDDLCVCYIKLGSIHSGADRLEESWQEYQLSRELGLEQIRKAGTIRTKENLAISEQRLGMLCNMQGEPEEAKSYYQKSLELYWQLLEESESVSFKRGLLQDLVQLGSLYHNSDCLDDEEQYLLKELELRGQWSELLDTTEDQRQLPALYISLGNNNLLRGRSNEATGYYQGAIRLCIKLCESDPSAENYHGLASAYYSLGIVNEKADQDMLKQASLIWSRLCQDYPEDPRFAQCSEMVSDLLDEENV